MLKDQTEASVEIGNHGELKSRRERLQDFDHFRIKFPHAGLSEMPIGSFEKGVAVERTDLRRKEIEDTIDHLAPPSLVIIFARLARRRTHRHLLPDLRKCPIQLRRIERKTLPARDQGIMLSNAFR